MPGVPDCAAGALKELCDRRGDPIAVAAQLIEAEQKKFPIRPSATNSPNLPFAGGAIGYFGFELARHIESLPATTIDDVGAADLVIGWYDAALVWDRLNQKGWLSGTTNAIADLSELLAGTKPRVNSHQYRGKFIGVMVGRRSSNRTWQGPSTSSGSKRPAVTSKRATFIRSTSRNAFPPRWRYRGSKPI